MWGETLVKLLPALVGTAAIGDPLSVIGASTGILMAIAVGIHFELPGKGVGRAALAHSGRLASAFLVALVFILVFGLTGADRVGLDHSPGA